MAIRKPKPTSPGRRFATYPDFAEVTTDRPEKTLVEGLTKDGVPARVATIEYDPNRSAYIALLHYVDGEKAYILAPARLSVGMMVSSGPDADIAVGCCLPLSRIPIGTIVHNVELQPGR